MESSTKLIFQLRNEVIPVGGYGQYRKTCSQKLLQLRRKLKITTPKGRRYEPKKIEEITLDDYRKNGEWKDYLIFSAERAWAHAMDMKSFHAAEAGDAALTGQIRTHVLSRLVKAAKAAAHLVSLSKQQTSTDSEKYLLLAHGAYWRLLEGSAAFEAQKWEKCLQGFSESHVLYTALGEKENGNFYHEWTADNVEPSIRYAAYQLRLPRTMAIQKMVARYASRDSFLVKEALKISPSAITDDNQAAQQSPSTAALQDLPSSISWRGRTVKLEDARIAQALGAVRRAEATLAERYSTSKEGSAEEQAAAYEEVLIPSQDAVDATKTALDELTAERVAPSDPRVQSLQITRTAVNYDLIGWRIGRNRVLCGRDDGATFDEEPPKPPKSRRGKSEPKTEITKKPREEGSGRKLARLRQRVVLYDTTLQSLDSIRELPGIAADQDLLKKLASRKAYFAALRSLAIARSHAILGNSKNALALFAKASQSANSITATDDNDPGLKSGVPQHYLTKSQAESLQSTAQGLKIQFQALAELDNLENEAIKAEKAKSAWSAPLIERLNEYPAGGADLGNLVSYPPKLRPIPVNPIFLDVAWNYINYPTQTKRQQKLVEEPEVEAKPAKRGWFPFGGRN